MSSLSQEEKDRRNRKREETYRRRRGAYAEKLKEQQRRAEQYDDYFRQLLKTHGSFKEALFAAVGDFGALDTLAQIRALQDCWSTTRGMMEAHRARMAREERFRPRSKRNAKLAKIDAVANDTRGNANVRAAAQAMAEKIRRAT
jgi:hypothetical protein